MSRPLRRPRARSPVLRDLGVFVLYFASLAIVIGIPVLEDPRGTCLCGGDADPAIVMWSLRWWPWAVLHGASPFVAHVVAPPFYAAAPDTLPGVAVLFAPVTLALGPVFAYNVLALVGPPLGAYTTFRLARRLCGATAPAIAAGYLYLFSSAVLVQLRGHANLFLAFLFPVMAEFVVARVRREISRRAFVAGLAVLLALQLSISPELLFDAAVISVLTFAVAFAREPQIRERMKAIGAEAAVAGAAAAVLASPLLYYLLKAPFPARRADLPNGGALDVLNPIVPTKLTRIGANSFAGVSSRFETGTVGEAGGYVGIVLLAAYATFAIRSWRSLLARILTFVTAATFLFALGAHLYVAGFQTAPMPYDLLAGLPGFASAVPSRAAVLGEIAIAVGLAVWLASSVRPSWRRWLVVVAGAAFLFPNPATHAWRSEVHVPAVFASDLYKRYLSRGDTVLALPFSFHDNATLWQAKTDFYFKLADADLTHLPDSLSEGRDPVVDAAAAELFNPGQIRVTDMAHYLKTRHVDAIVLDTGRPAGLPSPQGIQLTWQAALNNLGLRPQAVPGALIYRLPARGRLR